MRSEAEQQCNVSAAAARLHRHRAAVSLIHTVPRGVPTPSDRSLLFPFSLARPPTPCFASDAGRDRQKSQASRKVSSICRSSAVINHAMASAVTRRCPTVAGGGDLEAGLQLAIHFVVDYSIGYLFQPGE